MDGFNDFLDDLKRQGGPLLWVTQKKEFLENVDNNGGAGAGGTKKRTAEQIKEAVLRSARLKHVVDQLLAKPGAAEAGLRRQQVEAEARSIVDEMAHEFDLKYVRMIGFVLVKVFARIYEHIYYNADMVANLEVLKHYPVVMLPLHRSYMDFLLVSILCFHKNVQLPAIAAGQDFLGLAFLGTVLRRSGAFFIRRSFGSDELYWAVFHQYVHEHMRNCDRPLEFFIEGTRSRTSKSLQPKQGMISTCIELYMKGRRVPDIYFVPISLTYERLLEELLYSNELLGIPKPKESVNGLVKARSILNQCYGSIFINFARPVSFRELISAVEGPTLRNRLSHTLTPAFIFELTPQQARSIESFSYLILLEMLRNQIIQPVSIIATCVLLSSASLGSGQQQQQRRRHAFERVRAVNLERLCYQVDQLKSILINLGVKVYWPVPAEPPADGAGDQASREIAQTKHLILDNLHIHSNIFELSMASTASGAPQTPREFEANMVHARQYVIKPSAGVDCACPFFIVLKQAHAQPAATDAEARLFESSSLFLALCSYRNQLVHTLVRVSFACQSLLAALTVQRRAPTDDDDDEAKWLGSVDEARAFEVFRLLVVTFNKEFIFNAGDELKDFQNAVRFLTHTNLVRAIDETEGRRTLLLDKFNIKKFFFYIRIFRSCFFNYVEVYSTLLGGSKHVEAFAKAAGVLEYAEEKAVSKAVQQTIFENMVAKLGTAASASAAAFDMEALSLNLISNALLSLKQFGVLSRVNGQKETSGGEAKYRFVLDLGRLAAHTERLRGLLLSNEHKLKYLNRVSKRFRSIVFDRAQNLLNSPDDMDDDDDGRTEDELERLFDDQKNAAVAKL